MDARLLQGIDGIDAAAWDGLVPGDDPFVRHAFLSLMETSGSATTRTGWQPLHLVLEEGGRPVGAAPLYAKSHSWGEYVFDHGWGDAYERSGGRYYPKLQVAVPFTPVPGPRLLAGGDPAVGRALAGALALTAKETGLSSLHVTFCSEEDAEMLAAAGFLLRRGIQYHWHNRGYGGFSDFLGELRSARRKTIRKERESVRAAGVEILTLSGDELAPRDLAGFYPFYRATVDKRWGSAYLSRRFFEGLGRELRDRVVYVVARKDGETVAAALNLWAGDTLYGRLWGCLESYRFLHFECCYYAAIDFAIAHGLARVEAGAQGTHKLLRGYEPVWIRSAHWIGDRGFRAAVERFLAQEQQQLEAQFPELREMLPYRQALGCPE
jgi:predicted N-acyltransferase